MTVRFPLILRASAIVLVSLMTAGCGGTSAEVRPQSASSSGWAGQQQVKQAMEMLNQGKWAEARSLLMGVLKKQPGDAIARKLIAQIDTPPDKLLGSKSFKITAAQDDTFATLAGRYLGDPMMGFALARYNEVAVPESLKSGQQLRIPGKEPVTAAAKDEDAPANSRSPSLTRTEQAKQKGAPPRSPFNPAKASTLRARGLEQLNRGVINSAVVLLAQANQMDPSNPLILRDLARARRIQKTVKP